MKPDKWKCSECGAIIRNHEILKAPSPFSSKVTIHGCPKCHSIDSLLKACDWSRCDKISSCGMPTKKGYKNYCSKHYDKYMLFE